MTYYEKNSYPKDAKSRNEYFNKELFASLNKITVFTFISEILDIFLFIYGFLIPLGDFIESIIGEMFDLLVIFNLLDLNKKYNFDNNQLKNNVKESSFKTNVKSPFSSFWFYIWMEMMDLTDFLTFGRLDLFGWLEIVPFWLLFIMKLTNFIKKSDLLKFKVNISNTTKESSNYDLNRKDNMRLKDLQEEQITIINDEYQSNELESEKLPIKDYIRDYFICDFCGSSINSKDKKSGKCPICGGILIDKN